MEKKEAGPEVVFTNKEFEDVTKYLIGNNVRLFPNLLVPQVCGEYLDHCHFINGIINL